MKSGHFDITRFRASDVTPLEVWNLELSGGPFWKLVGAPALEDWRNRQVFEMEIARAFASLTEEAIALLAARHRFDRVFLAGGLTDLVGFRSFFHDARQPVTFARSGQFAFELGGRALLGGAPGVILDVGQTAVKAVAGSKRSVKQRSYYELPRFFIGQPRPDSQRHIDDAIDFIGSAYSGVPAKSDARANIVLALPCPLNDALEPGGCTYGWESAKDLVPRIFANLEGRGRIDGDARALVMNDAELAAESARAHGVAGPALVLTLGFGPGGALITSS